MSTETFSTSFFIRDGGEHGIIRPERGDCYPDGGNDGSTDE